MKFSLNESYIKNYVNRNLLVKRSAEMRILNFFMMLILAALLFLFTSDNNRLDISKSSLNQNTLKGNNKPENKEEGTSSHEIEKKFFSEWNHPYENGIPPDVQLKIWHEINALPDEKEADADAVNSWQMLGPFGEAYPDSPSIKYSGRIKDVEPPRTSVELRVAAASGGIWRHLGFFGVPITNSLPTQWIGTFTTDPANSNIVFAGTGEPDVMPGIGLWKTSNLGASWQKDNFAGYTPWCFYKIRFDPNISGRIHAACTDGYFRSDNSGSTWVRKYAGAVTDFAINVFNNSSVVYIAEKNSGTGGILKSTNGGDNFTRITSLPTSDIGKSLVATGNSPNIVYVFLGRNSTQYPIGVYKSTNSGGNWENITPQNAPGFSTRNVEYKSILTVCPANPSIVMTGTTSMCRSIDGGQSWTEYLDIGAHPYRNLHGDHHRMEWKDDGNTVYSTNDGGIAVSSDRGATWSTIINILPVTQIYKFDVGISNKNVIYGGTQDNGIVKTVNLGSSWQFLFTGDGGGIEIDPVSFNKVFSTHGGSSVPNVSWGRYKTTDGGIETPWPEITNNISSNDDWCPSIHSDKYSPIYLYTNGGPYIYKSTNDGAGWTKLNTTAFPTPYIFNFSVSYFVSGGSVIYACLEDIPESGNHSGKLLRVYDNGIWYERSTGLPQSGAWVRNVAIHPTNTNIAYALMNGVNGQKIFKTTDRGVTWTNITGNLPNVPVSDLVPHPTDNNKLYLSSEFGCYKTSNGGTNWFRWNNGMPENLPSANTINDLGVIDSIAQNGKYYIVAATYGRGFWMREISGDDPIGVINNSIPVAYYLSQNYPNPFNPSTKINYSIAKSGIVKITVYDVLGRAVKILVDEKETPGQYTIEFRGENFSSGVYFYRIETEAFTAVKKMILLK
jgi:photosystem II stability/assembly factor-like uncharacterized protein